MEKLITWRVDDPAEKANSLVLEEGAPASAVPLELHERIRLYIERAGVSQGDVAKVLGIPVRKFNYYLAARSQVNLWPLLSKLLCADCRLSRQWLYFGEGDMWVDGQNVQSARGKKGGRPLTQEDSCLCASVNAAPVGNPLQLTGLANCGVQGWFSRAYKSVNISPPHCGADWIAVLAIGDSMLPFGIREGYTLFCDPSQTPASGEAVYALRRDGSATIKVYQGRDSKGWIVLQGWMPAQGEEPQKPYLDACIPSEIVLLAPVIYIKCRL